MRGRTSELHAEKPRVRETCGEGLDIIDEDALVQNVFSSVGGLSFI